MKARSGFFTIGVSVPAHWRVSYSDRLWLHKAYIGGMVGLATMTDILTSECMVSIKVVEDGQQLTVVVQEDRDALPLCVLKETARVLEQAWVLGLHQKGCKLRLSN